jgi:hypothetical protein
MADVADTLQLRPDQRVLVLEAPAEARSLLAGVSRADDGQEADVVLLFARDREVVAAHARRLRDHVRAGGIAWAAYPAAAARSLDGLSGKRGWDAVRELGLKPVREVALDPTWIALRLRFAEDETGA